MYFLQHFEYVHSLTWVNFFKFDLIYFAHLTLGNHCAEVLSTISWLGDVEHPLGKNLDAKAELNFTKVLIP